MKSFFIRLLQLVWGISFLIFCIALSIILGQFSEPSKDIEDLAFFLAVSMVFFGTLSSIQYLFLGKLFPIHLFNRMFLPNQKESNRSFWIVIIVSIFLSLGISIVIFLSNQYQKEQIRIEQAKKIQKGTDKKFFIKQYQQQVKKQDTYICDEVHSSKLALKTTYQKLKSQQLTDLQTILEITKQDDELGTNIRCYFYRMEQEYIKKDEAYNAAIDYIKHVGNSPITEKDKENENE